MVRVEIHKFHYFDTKIRLTTLEMNSANSVSRSIIVNWDQNSHALRFRIKIHMINTIS